jgi:hypothetical protein
MDHETFLSYCFLEEECLDIFDEEIYKLKDDTHETTSRSYCIENTIDLPHYSFYFCIEDIIEHEELIF